jgi:hypothetical protein
MVLILIPSNNRVSGKVSETAFRIFGFLRLFLFRECVRKSSESLEKSGFESTFAS